MSELNTEPKNNYNIPELIRKADNGDRQAMFDFLEAMTIGSDDTESYDEDICERMTDYARKLAAAGEPAGYYHLGQFCRNGIIFRQDVGKAAEYFMKAGEAGEPLGYELAGQIAFEKEEYEKAYELFQRAGEVLQPHSVYILSRILRLGLGTEADQEQANVLLIEDLGGIPDILEDLYARGDLQNYRDLSLLLAVCKYDIADALMFGIGEMPEDVEQAVIFLREAAEVFCEDDELYETKRCMIGEKLNFAEYLSGSSRECGQNMNRLAYFARHGDPEAMQKLAHIMIYEGDEKPDSESFGMYLKCYEESVRLGNTDAMLDLGRIYQLGICVEKDPEKAEKLYRKAQNTGNKLAYERLADLYSEETEKG